MRIIQGKSILDRVSAIKVRVSEGSSYRESTVKMKSGTVTVRVFSFSKLQQLLNNIAFSEMFLLDKSY